MTNLNRPPKPIRKSPGRDRARSGGGAVYDMTPEATARASQGAGPTANQGNGSGWFGPLVPLNPTAPPEVAGRAFDYPSGYNIVQQPRAYELTGFSVLRSFADNYDLLRLIIETRKDQIENLSFNFVPVDEDVRLQSDPKLLKRAKDLKKFFRRPDKDHFWGQWLRSILEDLLVIDAPALYVRNTLGGDLYALEQVDGATIKRVIDNYGRTPEEGPAYQQVLKGFPAVDYTRQELIYRPRNVRVHKVYGFSPVEQILMTVNIALRRQVFQLNYFTEGNVPEALIGVPETWTPDQIRIFQEWFDNMLSGNLAERRRAKFVPNAVGKTYIPTKNDELFGAAEEWFARVCCFAFSVSPQPFLKAMNRATADSADDVAKEEGLGPLKNWVKNLMDSVLVDYFDEHELQFHWVEPDELNAAKKSEVLIAESGKGLRPLNEVRRMMGEQPYEGEHFNKPMVMTSMGYVTIDPTLTPQQQLTGKDSRPDKEGNDFPDQEGKELPSQVSGDKPEEKGVASTKSAGDFFQRVRKLAALPIEPNRPLVNEVISRLEEHIYNYLQVWAGSLADQVEVLLKRQGVRKADEEIDLDKLLAELDLEISRAFKHVMEDGLFTVSHDAASLAAVSITQYDRTDKLFNQVFDYSVEWASHRAAELVSIDGDRNMVEGTRNAIRRVIAQGLSEGLSASEIAGALESNFAFSRDRALNIATYEIASANSHGALLGYKASSENTGLTLHKGWSVDSNPCEVCLGNAAEGPIPLDQPFSSGDLAPSAHPHCLCAIYAEVKQE